MRLQEESLILERGHDSDACGINTALTEVLYDSLAHCCFDVALLLLRLTLLKSQEVDNLVCFDPRYRPLLGVFDPTQASVDMLWELKVQVRDFLASCLHHPLVDGIVGKLCDVLVHAVLCS